MTLFKRFFCCALAFCISLTLLSCASGNNSGTDRELYNAEEKVTYTDEDHVFDYKTLSWDGPEGYVIVVPEGDVSAKQTAEKLKGYFSESLNTELNVVSDKTAETEKEILIGKTDRSQSDGNLAEADIAVSVKDGKLVFEGGHSVTLDTAVNRFIRLAPKKNEAVTFALSTDFKSSLQGGYEYVWGDEFEGNGIDFSKWEYTSKMSGSKSVQVSYEKNVVDVADGRLKLHAIHYFDNNNPDVIYRVPGSVTTQNKMNYVYGYLEVRSRVPYSAGVWASFWTQSSDLLKGTRNYDYMLEVDIYEVFFTYTKHSGLIHWYSKEFDYNSKYPEYNKDAEKGISVNTSIYTAKENPYSYVWSPSDSLNYEYHVYGYEWTPTEMKMYIDGVCHATYDITKSFDAHQDTASYHDPQHIIFNNHVFHPEISTASESIELNPQSLPACHYIDYIRLYQKPNQGELYTAD